MPRYDYRCEAGHKYELQQPFGSPTEHPCERCGKPARRQLVAPPLVFKSGGFYKTSGRGDSSSSSGDGPKGVRSKTPPKKSESTSSDSSSSSSASTASAASSDD
jgi:putative FmdB family regulatory protein